MSSFLTETFPLRLACTLLRNAAFRTLPFYSWADCLGVGEGACRLRVVLGEGGSGGGGGGGGR